MNMHYCRFQNTAKSMAECIEGIENSEYNDLSTDEKDGILDMLAHCEVILSYQEEIEEVINDEAIRLEKQFEE